MLLKIFNLIVFISFGLLAQNNPFESSEVFSISNGLAHNGVTTLLEDSKGYIWIGTYDGLNRYDGYKFTTFKNTVNNDLLVNNRIRTLAEDAKGNLWIGTDEGISIYNYSKEKFTSIFSNGLIKKGATGPIVRKILFNLKSKQVVCATESRGILLFTNNYKYQHQYVPVLKNKKQSILFYDGLAIDADTYLFSTSVGLISFNIQTKKFVKIVNSQINNTKTLVKISPNKILVALDKGIAIVNFEKKNHDYRFTVSQKLLETYKVVTATVDNRNHLWLGTDREGLVYINSVTNLIKHQTNDSLNYNFNPSLLRISCITIAKNGCWVGSFNKGVLKFDLKPNPFKFYNKAKNSRNGLMANEVMAIAPIDATKAYISTIQGGLSLFDTQTQLFQKLPFNIRPNYLQHLGAIMVDDKKTLWLSVSNTGIFRFKKNGSQLEKINHPALNKLSFDLVKIISHDAAGNILISTGDDVYKLVLDANQELIRVENLKSNPYFNKNSFSLVRAIYPDPLYKNLIWVGTVADGLFRINLGEKGLFSKAKIDRFTNDSSDKNAISSSFVTAILRLPNKQLWVATERGGICKVLNSDQKPRFISFSEKEGLSNNVVKKIAFDGKNSLWVTTNIGLNYFNTQTYSIQKFRTADGLPFEDFNYGYAQLPNGVQILAGFDGFCYFDPKDLPKNEKLARLEFGDLQVFNQHIKAGDTLNNRILLPKRLHELDELELNYNENVFSIGVTSLHFSSQTNHFIKYQLLPVNKKWVEIPTDQRTIYFSGLPPGNYTLNIKASNSLQKWTKTKTLKITIQPPFWKTKTAYFLYLVLFLLAGYFILVFMLRMQGLQHKVEIEQLEKNNLKEINAAKLRFFSNISHEIKTPLTLISGPVESLYSRFKNNPELGNTLLIIQKQSQKIAKLLDQVHDFQKADANLLAMNYTYFDFTVFVNELIAEYQFLAQTEQKNISITTQNKAIYVYADKDKLEKILNNIITNAFKYTKINDAIKLALTTEGKNVTINIEDNGKGIAPEDLPHIFERFYQSKKKDNSYYGGSGIGLAFSKQLVEMHYGYINAQSVLNQSTNINIVLPIIQEQYSPEQEEIENEVLTAEKETDQLFIFENIKYTDLKFDASLSESRIFIAEDNTDLRNYISNALSHYFKVSVFIHGKECLNALENDWPDLILSDVLMPEMNGFDLCKKIKSDIKTSHIPVVLLTACTTIDDQLKGLTDGADAYIKKPFNMQHLVSTIEAVLRNRKQLRERYQIELPLTLTATDNSNDTVFLEKLYSLMAQNLDNQDLELDLFAKDLFLSRTHFYQKVKTLTNCTPFELLKSYRLKKAAEFLIEGKMAVNEVYMMTGFKSRTHFSRLFKEKYDCTPGKYASERTKNS